MSRRQQGSADVKTFDGFPAEAFRFYQDLEKHNTRDHWHRHKDTYDSCVREPMEALAAELGEKYGAVKVWRPQRDVRFAKDKSPYKTYQGLTAGSADSVGYYLQLDAEGLRLGGGYHGLSSEQVERYREAVDDGRSGAALQRIVDELTADDWNLIGERLKTKPRDCPADHPRVELLRYRSLAADRVHRVSDGIDGEAAVRLVRDGWDALGPLVDWLDRHVSTTGGELNMLAGCVPWPPEFARRYTERGYWRPEPLGTRLRTLARADADRVALVEPARRMTYGELDRRADRLAAGLRRAGLSPGDRVVIQLPNVIDFVTLCHALFRLGALPVFALPAHRESELAHLCAMSDATALVIPDNYLGFDHRELARRVTGPEHVFVVGEPAEFVALDTVDAEPEPLPAPDPADVALFLLSGGTTGLPKLIPRTHQDYGYNLRISAENAGLTAADSYLAVLPIGHNYALACPGVLGTLHVGGRVVLAPTPSVEDVFPLIERERVTVTGLVPPLALLWLEMAGIAGADLSSLRLVQVGGAKFGADAARRFGPALGCKVQQSFGMAEGLLCQTALDDPPETVATTQGRPLSPDDEIRVVDASGAAVPDGEVGELLTRGPYTPRGYYRAEEHNASAFTSDGFFRTGDLVRLLPSGHLVVEGRVKDQINRGGDKVAADEVEDHLLAHPAVRECAVVAMPDPLIGERTCAFVVPGPRGAAPGLAEMVAFLRDRGLAAYKLPDRLEVVESFPHTAVGKVDKRRLRERIRELTGAQPGSTSAERGR